MSMFIWREPLCDRDSVKGGSCVTHHQTEKLTETQDDIHDPASLLPPRTCEPSRHPLRRPEADAHVCEANPYYH